MDEGEATADLQELLDVQDVSAITKIPVRTLRLWRHEGRGPRAFRIGKHLRYRRQDVAAWIDEEARRAAV